VEKFSFQDPKETFATKVVQNLSPKRQNKFYGIKDQDINYFQQKEPMSSDIAFKRIPGLSQEYKVRKSRVPIEVHSF
jgi:hypothetical protein